MAPGVTQDVAGEPDPWDEWRTSWAERGWRCAKIMENELSSHFL